MQVSNLLDVCGIASGKRQERPRNDMIRWFRIVSLTLAYISTEAQMTTHSQKHIPWYLWPFAALWKLIAVIVEMTGRLLAMVLGIVFIMVGVIISLTIIGAIIGIPLAIIGLLLLLRGMF